MKTSKLIEFLQDHQGADEVFIEITDDDAVSMIVSIAGFRVEYDADGVEQKVVLLPS